MNDELEEKTRRIVAMLAREDFDAVLLNAQHNFAWLTGGGSNGVDASRENGVASLLVTRGGDRYVLASRIEMGRMLAEEVSETEFRPLDFAWQDEKANGNLIVETAVSALGPGSRVASDLSLGGSAGVVESKIAPCRYRLTTDELKRIRQLGGDAAEGMARAIRELVPGQTELDIAEILRRELGLGGMTSVVTLVAADERVAQFRHPVPTAKAWQNTVLVVTCAKRNGLIVSLSRMIRSGPVPDELRRRTDVCAEVNARMLHATRPGSAGSEIYFAAAKAYETLGSGREIDLHHQGGAAGYKTREWVAHPKSGEIVEQHQAFAWNPSITGTKVEDTHIVTADGVETITAVGGEPRIVTEIDGKQYSSPGIITI